MSIPDPSRWPSASARAAAPPRSCLLCSVGLSVGSPAGRGRDGVRGWQCHPCEPTLLPVQGPQVEESHSPQEPHLLPGLRRGPPHGQRMGKGQRGRQPAGGPVSSGEPGKAPSAFCGHPPMSLLGSISPEERGPEREGRGYLWETLPTVPRWAGRARQGQGTRAGLHPRWPQRGPPHAGGVRGRHGCHAPPVPGRLLLDVGGGAAAVELGGGRERAPGAQDDALLRRRLG